MLDPRTELCASGVLIPRSALVRYEGQSFVYLRRPEGFHRVHMQLRFSPRPKNLPHVRKVFYNANVEYFTDASFKKMESRDQQGTFRVDFTNGDRVVQLKPGSRLSAQYSELDVKTGSADPTGYDLVVNATPLGMNEGDPLPIDMSLVAPTTFVGEVVMKTAVTPFLRAAQERGCETQVGTDMLFEQIPAYLEFFGFGTATPDELRDVAQIQY